MRATMVGNTIPDKNDTGNINARHSNATCHHEAILKAPAAVFTASPGNNRYEKSTAIAASTNSRETNRFDVVERREIAPANVPPSPIPASTTASMIAKAVGDDATYRRKNRNQITSSARRSRPVPKLTNSKRHGGR